MPAIRFDALLSRIGSQIILRLPGSANARLPSRCRWPSIRAAAGRNLRCRRIWSTPYRVVLPAAPVIRRARSTMGLASFRTASGRDSRRWR